MTRKITDHLSALLRIFPALVFLGLICADPALANPDFGTTSDEILGESCDLLFVIKDWLFNIIYILGAIGLVVIAVSAFLGRFKFSHLIALGGGLFIVAAADLLIGFITAGTGDTSC